MARSTQTFDIFSKIMGKFSLLVALVICLSVTGGAQPRPTETLPVIEVVWTACNGNGCDSTKVRLYADGRYTSETNGTDRSASGNLKKVKLCEETELEPEEVRKVIAFAEQPDFQNAAAEYAHIVIDYPDHFTVTYRNNGREKTVRVANFSRASEAERAKVPGAVVQLMKWAEPTYFSSLSK